MEGSEMVNIELTDLPNFKNIFTGPLAEIGVTSIGDLRQILMDDERTASMIIAVKGLGPRTVQGWKNALEAREKPCDTKKRSEIEPVVDDIEELSSKEETIETSTEDVNIPLDPDMVLPRTTFERNLFCTMDDLKEIERTTIDLLQMNGSKKKGLMASMDYVTKRLGSAGMEVTVNQESDVPAIVASKGEGGIVLWGHLDTDSLGGMEHKDQGTVQGGIINGRGAANMKGAVAVMLCVATRLSSWDVPFAMVLTTDALNEQKGAEALSKDPVVQNSKGILILGPTDMTPVIAQVGYAAIQVRTLGDGAVMNMAAFLKKLNDHVKDSSGKLKVKTGSIKGGKKSRPFEMAQSCEVTMELETLDSTDSAITMIDELLEDMEHDTRLLCRSEMVEFDQFSDLAKEVTELSKKEPVSEMVHSEAAMIAPVNQKIVVCGPGTLTNSLSDHEYVTLNELEGTYEAILNLVDRSSPVP